MRRWEKVILREEKEKLRVEKELLQSNLSASEKKCQNLEKHAAKVERSALFWKRRFRNIVSQVIKQKRRRGKEKGKTFQDYSARSRRRMRRQITNDCQEALNFLGLYELIPTRVKYYNIITHSIEEIDLRMVKTR